MDHLPEGAPAPDFTLNDIFGRRFHLASALADGEVTLVFFKASCPTCQLTFPYLQRLWAGYSPAHPRLWAVSQDSIPETRAFAAELSLEMPFLIDDHPFVVSDAYAVRTVPTIYFIDRDQRIRIADSGFSKPALRRLDQGYAEASGGRGLDLFGADDRLPERCAGCGSNN